MCVSRCWRVDDGMARLTIELSCGAQVHNMDGFYVAKLKVGKPAKAVLAATNGDAAAAADLELDGVTDDEDEAGSAGEGGASNKSGKKEAAASFDADEDAKIMEQEKIKALKRKGIKVVPKAKQAEARQKKKQRKA